MDTTTTTTASGLKTLTPFSPFSPLSPFRMRSSKVPLFRSLCSAHLHRSSRLSLSSARFSPLCSLYMWWLKFTAHGQNFKTISGDRGALNVLLQVPVYFSAEDFSYRRGDFLIFGSETSGLPPEALEDCKSETIGGGTIRIPMVETYVRCLNLSVSVGIALYEAARQLNYEQFDFPNENCIDSEKSFVTEDIFA
ncbi:hypothetical protein C1H46_029351 [Malus baccata]|uniref:tRNA/rRNA methyltransferase SpoU type domain-containing protein n=1 Tax=Malus baccata TaxID=106549 RepID=A0A540LF10_MALBA|nr:hypothetical protein C1H46_029351 [Malus baccata]